MARAPRSRPWRRVTVLLALVAGTGACSSTADDPEPAASSPASTSTTIAVADADEADGPSTLCDGMTARTDGRVANGRLLETSGLAVSRAHPGVYWAHNDSGHEPAVVALGPDGHDLGSFPLPDTSGVDIEDMALVDGTIYLADIGDNTQRRRTIAVYLFAEPDPGSPAPIDAVETITLRYPDGARDAEAFLVDPLTGELIIIEKRFRIGGSEGVLSPAPAEIFVANPPFDPGGVELRSAGTVPLDALDRAATATVPADSPFGTLGVAGLATGADIRSDGLAIALRTYATVWLFDRADGQSVSDALAGQPCEAPTIPEPQGEAVAFLDDVGAGFVTISEGVRPPVNTSRRG